MAQSGTPWRQLPTEYGKWDSVYRRYARWRDQGVWPRRMAHRQADPELSAVWAGQHGHARTRQRGGRTQAQRRLDAAEAASAPRSTCGSFYAQSVRTRAFAGHLVTERLADTGPDALAPRRQRQIHRRPRDPYLCLSKPLPQPLRGKAAYRKSWRTDARERRVSPVCAAGCAQGGRRWPIQAWHSVASKLRMSV